MTHSFWAHIQALKETLLLILVAWVVGSTVSYVCYNTVFTALTHSILGNLKTPYLWANAIFDGFYVKLQLSLWAGFFMALPFIMVLVFRFLEPGLYTGEKKSLVSLMVISYLSTSLGLYMALKWILPWIFYVCMAQSAPLLAWGIQWAIYLKPAFGSALRLLGGILCIYQIPVAILFTVQKNPRFSQTLLHSHQYIVVGMLIGLATISSDMSMLMGLGVVAACVLYVCLLLIHVSVCLKCLHV